MPVGRVEDASAGERGDDARRCGWVGDGIPEHVRGVEEDCATGRGEGVVSRVGADGGGVVTELGGVFQRVRGVEEVV